MEENKKNENMPSENEKAVTEKNVNSEMSSEAIKVNMYSTEDKYANDPNFDNEEFMRYWSPRERRKREREAAKVKKVKGPKRKLTKVGKILLGLCGVALAAVAVYFIYYFIHYVNYNHYKDYLSSYEYEEAKVYKPIADSQANVDGFELVAETDCLKLYTDPKTANVAIYDKRNGETVYTNPVNAEEDTIANGTNINIMKSQFVVYYYNSDVTQGTFNSYTDCVSKGAFTIEGLDNGLRYIYTVGDATAGCVIPLEYRLIDDYLQVSIPACAIEEMGNAFVSRIQLLRYMAATSYDDTGYMVVPNGSGSIINFNNGKKSASTYSQYIYDIDPLAANYTTVESLEAARLPLFGICKENSSVLCTIEDSVTNSVVTAGISGTFSDYNYAYPSFVLRVTDNLRMFGDSTTDVYVMEPKHYESNICVRYSFLTEENKGYSGIANYYRQRLIDEGVLKANAKDTDIPFYYDVITGVKETGHVLGVQYLHTFSMTDFDEAGQMSDEFKAAGISNQVVNLQGWFNRGYYHDATDNINITSILGGKSGLERLNKKIADNGGTLFADVAFQQVTFADKWFPYQKEAARYYGAGYVASFGLVNPTTLRNTAGLGYTENRYNLISPKFLPRYVESFAKKTSKLDVDGISLRDLGNVVTSDKKRTCMIDREESLDIVIGQFDTLQNTGKQIMTNRANAYVFAYTSDIINAPIKSTEYAIVDAEIPLYEMIIHGYIDYSCELMNFDNNDNVERTVLKLIETGASPHYVFTMEESSRMKLTALNRFYTTTYSVWKDDAVDTYNTVNNALRQVSGCAIVNHEIIDNNVRKVTYDNGVTIIVNYGKAAVTVDGVTVEPLSYGMEGK